MFQLKLKSSMRKKKVDRYNLLKLRLGELK